MLGKLCLPLAMLAVFLAPADAGEENLMAMRGNTPGAQPGMNQFRPERRADAARRDDARAVENLTANGLSLANGAYVGWRDNRAHTPRLVAGQALDVQCPGGYGWATPLPREPEVTLGAYIELFYKELAQVRVEME
ncbi:MAG: hypothetical protein LUE17_03415 [Planctomycetaceae bacterium]|nr:hypothetical protein [Planctomycetaceae bacterium]